MAKDTIQGEFEYRKMTRGGKTHMASSEASSVAGALYLTPQQVKKLGIDEDSKLTVQITVRAAS